MFPVIANKINNINKLSLSRNVSMVFIVLIAVLFLFSRISKVEATSLSANSPITVVATYYGGEFNNHWVIDNANQCTRITEGEFSADSLNAVVDAVCDDDNGLGYQNDIPLHNTVSFAELSINPNNRDYSALGNLVAGTRVEIEYKGRCVIAEKRDVGTGGYGMNGYPRAIDLWWQTARSLGFTSGFDTVNVRLAGSEPLTPLGQTSTCGVAPASTQSQNTTVGASQKAGQTQKVNPNITSKKPASVQSGTPPSQPEPALGSKADTKSASVFNNQATLPLETTAFINSSSNYLKFIVPFFVGMFLMGTLLTNRFVKYRKQIAKSFKKYI